MAKMPDYTIPELQTVLLKAIVKQDVKRNNFAIIYIISYFPANAPLVLENPNAFVDHLALL
ncbi:hypothetical protein HKBW3S44_01468 [Candidatus Hakubella thermalkaliphila]|uniref:Uncharacterized protein n=1 Tax=Candidatus Hakubella thermalkaliphila TaxID=2754717 RepID=A0A6V8PZ56_9ACTN|nr:hypothetical protein HKBW3S44_01468 [Candidatus Hakubella thermalkaliphila]GFP43355.1 hypothetical protein HKBW3C_02485 [Candidatus Hakubella thermalkaliphila]